MATLESYFKNIDKEFENEPALVMNVSVGDLPKLFEGTNPQDEAANEKIREQLEKLEKEKHEITELKEHRKQLSHQLILSKAERDTLKKQLNDAKSNLKQELSRRIKSIDKVRTDVVFLLKVQRYLKQLLANEYDLRTPKPKMKPTMGERSASSMSKNESTESVRKYETVNTKAMEVRQIKEVLSSFRNSIQKYKVCSWLKTGICTPLVMLRKRIQRSKYSTILQREEKQLHGLNIKRLNLQNKKVKNQ